MSSGELSFTVKDRETVYRLIIRQVFCLSHVFPTIITRILLIHQTLEESSLSHAVIVERLSIFLVIWNFAFYIVILLNVNVIQYNGKVLAKSWIQYQLSGADLNIELQPGK